MKCIALTLALLAIGSHTATAQQSVNMVNIAELSGIGATSGNNFTDGAKLAVKHINAKGGILGREIKLESLDSQSTPGVAKALATKAVDSDAYVILGPGFSGSMIVAMSETQRAEIPNFTAAEASTITQRGNPYIFRTSFSQATSMPKVAKYIADGAKAKSVAVIFVNNDFGKGGRDAITKELGARKVNIAADISTDPGQLDFSSAVLRAKQSGADLLFVYLLEEESARLLRELRKQGWDKPIVGETTLIEQKVIDLAGEAVSGVRGHVGLTIEAPNERVRKFAADFEAEYKYKPNHNGIKGYTGVHVIKAVTEKLGKFDRKAFAAAMKGVKLSAKDHPGILMDVAYDQNGDIDRESYLVEVKSGKHVIVETLPPLNP
jgi:branched-chain amino acid transport system substrate-binding protein